MIAGPPAPDPAEILDLEEGMNFTELPTRDRNELQEFVDGILRPAVKALALAGTGVDPVLRAADAGMRELVEGLADGTRIPMSEAAMRQNSGARDLTREEVLRVLDTLEQARKQQFSRPTQTLIAKVVGPKF